MGKNNQKVRAMNFFFYLVTPFISEQTSVFYSLNNSTLLIACVIISQNVPYFIWLSYLSD